CRLKHDSTSVVGRDDCCRTAFNPSGRFAKPSYQDSLTVMYFVAQFAHVPNLHGPIPASRDQTGAVDERQAADEAGMAAEVPEQLSGVAIPDLHGAVFTRRGDPPAPRVGAEGHGTDVPIVPFEGFQRVTGLHVPDLDGVSF